MKKKIALVVLSMVLFSCNKKLPDWEIFEIEGRRTTRTVAEILFPKSSIDNMEDKAFEDGLIYDTVPSTITSKGIWLSPNAVKVHNINNLVNIMQQTGKYPTFLTDLKPKTKYYVRGYRKHNLSGRLAISRNEVEIMTTNETAYNNLVLTVGSSSHSPRIGYANQFNNDYSTKVGAYMNNYKDMLQVSMEIYVDGVKAEKMGPNLYNFGEGGASNGVGGIGPWDPNQDQPRYSDYKELPLFHLSSVNGFFLNVPCSFASGGHDVKLKFDGYNSVCSISQLAPYTYSAALTLSKKSGIPGDAVYINGLDSTNAYRSFGLLVGEDYIGYNYDTILNKYYLKIPGLPKGTYKVRLYYNCDHPFIGNLTIL